MDLVARNASQFLEEAELFCKHVMEENVTAVHFSEPFFKDVIVPMHLSWHAWKLELPDRALKFATQIAAEDWSAACKSWLLRRIAK